MQKIVWPAAPIRQSFDAVWQRFCNPIWAMLAQIEAAGRSMSQDGVFVPGEALRSAEILFVDSESQRRDAMRRMLLNIGVGRIQMAESGKEALNVLFGTPCNVVIVEHRMTPMDGIQLVREIRAVANYPRALVPVLVLGEAVGTDIITAALQAGANQFLIKPLTPAKLYERISGALSDQRPFMVKDGRYVIRPAKPKPSAVAAAQAATK